MPLSVFCGLRNLFSLNYKYLDIIIMKTNFIECWNLTHPVYDPNSLCFMNLLLDGSSTVETRQVIRLYSLFQMRNGKEYRKISLLNKLKP